MPSILHKRGTESALLATNPIIASGELIYSTDTYKLKIGDGITTYSGLPTINSGIYAPLAGASFTGAISSTSGNFTTGLTVNTTGVSLSGHTHTSSNITDFNSSVSGLISSNITNASNLYLWSNFR